MKNPLAGKWYPSVPTQLAPSMFFLVAWVGILASFLSAGPLGPGSRADRRREAEAEVHWRNDAYLRSALPDSLGEEPRRAIDRWADWAVEHGFRMDLSTDARVLLLLRTKKLPKKELALMEETLAMFDTLLPAPPRHADGSPVAPEAAGPAATRTGPDAAWKWIQVGSLPDTETIVLIGAKTQGEYAAAVDVVVAAESYLGPWAAYGKQAAGFVLERPLCGAWLEGGPGIEEDDPGNELVHRLARLLTLRRFGRQPWWLTLGLAWYFEIELRGDVYCFPYRNGFVGRAEHGSWPSKLKGVAKKSAPAIEVDGLAHWKRGEWDDDKAVLAWGTATYLSQQHAEALPRILEDFRILANARGIERRTDGSWTLLPDFVPTVEDQAGIMAWHLGEEFGTEMQEALAKGKRYRGRAR